MKEKLTSQFVGTGQTKNRTGITQPNQNELKVIKGILTSRIEKRIKDKETYYYGFFHLEGQNQEIPVIFKTKPSLEKGSRVQLTGTWANSNKERPSFTCHTCRLIAEPQPLTITSLQKTLQPLLTTCLEKKSEWTTRTDFVFKKKKDLEEIERMSKLGSTYLTAYLLTKQAFYANYQTEHLEQADFSLETYLARINSELERESSQVQAYLSKERVNQSFASLANNSLQITLQALNEKDQVIKDLEQKLANCSCSIELERKKTC